MRLTENNIHHVLYQTFNDKSRYYFVSMKSNKVSDNREFWGDESKLPKSVQSFIHHSICEEVEKYESSDGVYVNYKYAKI